MPITLLLEHFVPYDKSLQWQLHDAYFARRGIAAWTEGDVPYFSTSNYAIARQHALLLISLVRDLEAQGAIAAAEPVYAMEIGSGLGQFVVNLFRALDGGTGKAGKALARRLRYLFTDYSETSVREALRADPMQKLESEGRLAGALFDVRRPKAITTLDGKRVEAPITALYSNYVCCVTHMKHLRKTRDGFFEKYVRISAEVPDPAPGGTPPTPAQVLADLFDKPTKPDLQKELKVENEWRRCDLAEVFQDPVHAATVRDALAPLDEATLGYPYAFLDMLRGLRAAMRPEGVFLVNDYGSSEPWEIRGLTERRPQHYGNTMNQGVDYVVFDAFAKHAGMGILRTHNAFRSVHTALLRTSEGVPAPVRRAFKQAFLDREDGEDMLDFGAAAKQWLKAEEPARAVRLLQRCVRLDPLSAEARYRLGDACLDAGYNEPALRILEEGRGLFGAKQWDFDFQIGRACYRLKLWRKAEKAYQASLQRENDAVTHANLGVIYEELQDYKKAYACYRKSAETRPDYERAKTLIRSLEQLWAEKTLGGKKDAATAGGDAGKGADGSKNGGKSAGAASEAVSTLLGGPGPDGRADEEGLTRTRTFHDGVIEETVSFGEAPEVPQRRQPPAKAAATPPATGKAAEGAPKGAAKARSKAGKRGARRKG